MLVQALEVHCKLLDSNYSLLRRELAQEILAAVNNCSPAFFEQLVVDLLVAMGYGGSRADAGEAIGQSGDEGIDGLIKEDRLGLETIYLQAKRWRGTPVGRPIVQGFVGSLEGKKARKGIMITTSRFSRDAISYAESLEKRVVLIDGSQLAEMMIDFGVGVTPVVTYAVKRIDGDYFAEEP